MLTISKTKNAQARHTCFCFFVLFFYIYKSWIDFKDLRPPANFKDCRMGPKNEKSSYLKVGVGTKLGPGNFKNLYNFPDGC